jgi:hypothetical protein
MHREYSSLAAISEGLTTGRVNGLACGGRLSSRAPHGSRTSSNALFGWKPETCGKVARLVLASTSASGQAGKPWARAQLTNSPHTELAATGALAAGASGLADEPLEQAPAARAAIIRAGTRAVLALMGDLRSLDYVSIVGIGGAGRV